MMQEISLPPAQKAVAACSAYLHPYVCFRCCKSFKRSSRTQAVLPCPDCSGPSIGLTRKFKPPKRTDSKQWAKVEALVRHGFLFWSIGTPYPEKLSEVEAFALENAEIIARERKLRPAAYRQIDEALSLSR